MSQSAAENLHTWRCLWTDVLQWQRDNTVSAPIMRNGTFAVPTAATFALRSPTAAVITATAATLADGTLTDGTVVEDCVPTYVIPSASLPSTAPLGEGWMMTWTATIGGRVYTTDRPAAVCRVPLVPVITDADLLLEHPDLTAWRPAAETSFQKAIDASWAELMGRLSAEGRLTYIMKPAAAFRQWHLYTTLGRIFVGWSKSQTRGNWMELSKFYQDKANTEWGRITVQLDRDQNGIIDDISRREGGFMVLNINAPVGGSRAIART